MIDTAKKQRDAVVPVAEAEPQQDNAVTAGPSTETTGETTEGTAPGQPDIKEDEEEKAKREKEVKRKVEVAKSRAIKLLKAMGAR